MLQGQDLKIKSECPRIFNIVQVRSKDSGIIYRVVNLHLDHISDEARVRGMDCVLNMLDEREQRHALSTVILGDFNACPDSLVKKCKDHHLLNDITAHIPYSFHCYGREMRKIDYIFVSNELKKRVSSVAIWDDSKDGIYLSDYYPICATIDQIFANIFSLPVPQEIKCDFIFNGMKITGESKERNAYNFILKPIYN